MSNFRDICHRIRQSILDIAAYSGSGHIPSAFSLVEILVPLYYFQYRVSLKMFQKNEHDSIILSKGHGCLAQYAILADLGFFSREEFKKFASHDGILGGHPSSLKVPGIDFSTGSLGHGLSFAIGKALALKKIKSSRKVAVILGDGECNEGSIWEAAMALSKYQLSNLEIFIDRNQFQSYGPTEEILPLEPFSPKWQAFNLEVSELDLIKNSQALLDELKSSKRSNVYICKTIKGMGSSILENDISWHHKTNISNHDIDSIRRSLK